eukprot:GHVL01024638.1.p1 GENE.GHVL01024638.1~~GHVL01024638.1.p1  ORF type:complete len:115 (+),score=11.86 GHVL01024638.1:71-415(+)
MSLSRISARASNNLLPLRKSTKAKSKPLGSYPVSKELYHFWGQRTQVIGGQIEQQVSGYQQKIFWQYFQEWPKRNYARIEKHFWRTLIPLMLLEIALWKMYYDCRIEIQNIYWY